MPPVHRRGDEVERWSGAGGNREIITRRRPFHNCGEGRAEQTVPGVFSADETCDIGVDYGSAVTKDYGKKAHFNGEVNWVEFDIGAAANDPDHQISPEERFRVAMAIQ